MKRAGEDRNKHLLRIAARLFRTKGYAATSVRDIARALRLESSSLYHYIDSKEELLYRICVQSLDELMEKVEPIVFSPLPPLEKLQRFIETHVDAILEDRDRHAVMLFELRSLSPRRRKAIVQLRDRYEQLVLRMVEEGQQAGLLRQDLSARYLKLALLNLLNWSIFWYRPHGPLDSSAVGGLLGEVFLHGVLHTGVPHNALAAAR
ncbi:MAG: TetR/AcrR family transcriptional regulator [Armatimonadota bacterium]|nr:TetR/AcrR family transcriptional regulator [Armatimonadota bacterium]